MSTRLGRQPLLAAFVAALIFSAGGTVVGITTGTVPAASAQDQSGGPPPPGAAHSRRMGQLLMSLGLSDQQKSQIRAIISDARKQNQSVTDRDTRHANMKAAYEKVDAVLTPAQRTEYHTKRDAMRQANSDARAQ